MTTRELSPGKTLARGRPAPAGFSITVSSYLRQHAARLQLKSPQAPYPVKERFRLLDAVAHEPAAAGDSDPRVRSLWAATKAEHGESATAWAPGPQQTAVLDAASSSSAQALEGGFELDEGRLLNALAHAALLDVQTALERKMERLKRAVDLPPTHAAIVGELTTRAENAERALADARLQVETMRAGHVAERQKRRHYQALVEGSVTNGGVPEAAPDVAPEVVELPKPKAKPRPAAKAPALTASGPVGGADTSEEE